MRRVAQLADLPDHLEAAFGVLRDGRREGGQALLAHREEGVTAHCGFHVVGDLLVGELGDGGALGEAIRDGRELAFHLEGGGLGLLGGNLGGGGGAALFALRDLALKLLVLASGKLNGAQRLVIYGVCVRKKRERNTNTNQ